jgi:hypothetical protein
MAVQLRVRHAPFVLDDNEARIVVYALREQGSTEASSAADAIEAENAAAPPGQPVVIQENWIRPLLDAIQGNVVTDTLRKLFAVARDVAEQQ